MPSKDTKWVCENCGTPIKPDYTKLSPDEENNRMRLWESCKTCKTNVYLEPVV